MPYDSAGRVTGTINERKRFDRIKKAAERKSADKKYKGNYAGPDKYKGVVPKHLQKKYKGKYFGKDSNKGGNISPQPGEGKRDVSPISGIRKAPIRSVKKSLKSYKPGINPMPGEGGGSVKPITPNRPSPGLSGPGFGTNGVRRVIKTKPSTGTPSGKIGMM